MDAVEAREIEVAVKEIVARLCPEARGRAMYGGTIFERQPGVYKSGFGGVFCYQRHVSLEFSEGARLNDPDGMLEGRGKARRHLKLRALSDIEAKQVEAFLIQAIALGTSQP